MRRKVQPSEEIRKEIRRLWDQGVLGEQSALRALLDGGMRPVLQEMLEAEVGEYLGRGYYERRSEGQAHRGYRNGYERGRIKTAEGELHVRVPQVRDSREPFVSKLRPFFGSNKEAILVAWGVCRDGSKVLLHLALGNKESRSCWVEFFEDMRRRGLPVPLLVTSDGCPGLIGAIEEVFPLSLRARCWYHRMQNLRAKVIPGFLTEKSALKLIFSVMIRVARRWNRIPMNRLEQAQLETLRRELGIERAAILEVKEQKAAVRAS